MKVVGIEGCMAHVDEKSREIVTTFVDEVRGSGLGAPSSLSWPPTTITKVKWRCSKNN